MRNARAWLLMFISTQSKSARRRLPAPGTNRELATAQPCPETNRLERRMNAAENLAQHALRVPPVKGCTIHRETRSDRAVGSDDHIILTGPTVPLRKMQLAIFLLLDSWH